ncbi:MAG: glycosyltransferase family 2 protein [Acidobacteriaceae bacterium]
MPPQYEASVVIVSFNTRETLRECLESVLVETEGLRSEILVVDNNSRDGSAEMVEREFPGVRLIRAGTNLGFGSANNLALQQARGRYFVLLNSDAFFRSGALATAIRHMDENPDCGLAGGRLIGRDGQLQPSARSFHTIFDDLITLSGLAARFPKSRFFGRFDRTWADPNEPAEVDWVPGAFCIIRPSALVRVGLFNPIFFLYYEEVDLCLRIKRAGYRIWYWPDVFVVHIGGESSRQMTDLKFSSSGAQVVLWRMRSTLLYYRMYHGWKVHAAKWLELTFYAGRVARNYFSRDPVRQERSRSSRTLIQLMNQAWNDTQGGTVSPPRPW